MGLSTTPSSLILLNIKDFDINLFNHFYQNLSQNKVIEFRERRGSVKKRSIHVVCEHFELFHNVAMGT